MPGQNGPHVLHVKAKIDQESFSKLIKMEEHPVSEIPQSQRIAHVMHPHCFLEPCIRSTSLLFFLLIGPYKLVRSGTSCNKITSKAECEQAATQLGLPANATSNGGKIAVQSTSSRISGCWYAEKFHQLVINSGASSISCGHSVDGWVGDCICKQ